MFVGNFNGERKMGERLVMSIENEASERGERWKGEGRGAEERWALLVGKW